MLRTSKFPRCPSPPTHGLLGHLPAYRRDVLGFLTQSANSHGEMFRARFAHLHIHIASSPELVREILIERAAEFSRGRVHGKLQSLLGKGVLTVDGEPWRRQRRMMQPSFHQAGLQGFFESMVLETEQMLAEWEPARGSVRAVSDDFMKLTLRIVSRALFGFDTRADEAVIGRAVEWILPEIYRRLPSFFSAKGVLPTRRNRLFRARLRELDRVIYGIIAERRRTPHARADLLSTLMGAVDEEGDRQGLNDRQLRDEVMTLFMAGHETTATALAWTMDLLVRNPDVLRRAKEEVRDTLGQGPLTMEKVRALDYLRCIFEEALRLYPPIWSMPRNATRDTTLAGYRIRRGDGVSVGTYLLHRNPRIWAEPSRFDPLRFTAANRAAIPKYGYLPFGVGPHVCVGNTFAQLEGLTILALMLARFDFARAEDEPVRPAPTITLRPERPVSVWLS